MTTLRYYNAFSFMHQLPQNKHTKSTQFSLFQKSKIKQIILHNHRYFNKIIQLHESTFHLLDEFLIFILFIKRKFLKVQSLQIEILIFFFLGLNLLN